MSIKKTAFLLLCVYFTTGFYTQTKQLEPDFNQWKTTLLRAISEEYKNIPKDRDARIIKLDSSISSRITNILSKIEVSEREKLYKKLKDRYIRKFNFDKLIMIDLSISGEMTINDVLFLFVKGQKCMSIMCCKDFAEISSKDYSKYKLYLNSKDLFHINWYDQNSRSFTDYIIITEFSPKSINTQVVLNITTEQFQVIGKMFYN